MGNGLSLNWNLPKGACRQQSCPATCQAQAFQAPQAQHDDPPEGDERAFTAEPASERRHERLKHQCCYGPSTRTILVNHSTAPSPFPVYLLYLGSRTMML
jgi:hypothetical protein